LPRILALDYGAARIGVAVSDETGTIASPLCVVEVAQGRELDELAATIERERVERVVVGLPRRLAGDEGPAAQAVRAFIAALSERLSVPVVTWDERMTTAQAERAMIAGGARREQRRARIDKVAAAVMLQSYLDAKRTGGT
jgi:putative Holliday junction resolvase